MSCCYFLSPDTESKPEIELENKSVSQHIIETEGWDCKFMLLIKSLF